LTLPTLEAVASKQMQDPSAASAHVPGYHGGASLYDRLAAPLWEATVGRRAIQWVRNELRLHVPAGGSVLDLGAGTGRSTRLILDATSPGHVVAVDASADMLAQARRRLFDPRVDFRQTDAQDLPFADASFDAVLSLWMLETLPDPLTAVRQALRVLRPTGALVAAFSTTPTRGRSLLPRLIEAVMQPVFAGRFLADDERPLHGCTKRCAHRFSLGMTTVGVFGKDCYAPAVLSLPPSAAAAS
jgi:ubiquinone/menaquinone biosynthesis C-methylase UbiE